MLLAGLSGSSFPVTVRGVGADECVTSEMNSGHSVNTPRGASAAVRDIKNGMFEACFEVILVDVFCVFIHQTLEIGHERFACGFC